HRGGLTVVPQFAVDLADFPFRPHTIDPQGERDGAERVVGFIGRLVPEKGVDLLLRAAQEVIAGGQAIRLMIVGQGSEREALERLAATLGIAEQVTFFGHVPSLQMPTLYPQLDVLCLPSRTLPTWKEQFGRVILEAMASGVPVIGSDSGAIPDVIGDAGVIVPEENPHALAEALRGLLSDPARHADLAQKGRARVEAYFTHQRIAEATVRVYERLWRKPL
ncbi:MAG TPA: glycosyltransferase family 4 protein, partial [Aggregatilineales bacterium]|nr:glycosyltransferase family 4 protein [Aggregatilineales bacterium]